ncbi:hypothetical protein T265_10057 [Opisthorchis viverrini]|uniref:Metal-dependent protein hydrolase n=1 Tax=Opisthorchis viverrini TaxID=6198 RepID=A0A074Z3R7_OPIVI|nr:hypothetical protein T265_10057 [Opisthorchis viverrini]KER21668.1 hypothetical protein T265_10057 [Opisthorchis viverrini]
MVGSIGTHAGCFHCDEVFAVFLLKQLPQFKDYSIVRSRDPDVLEACDVVVDVGGVYDPDRLRFDHHQKGFDLNWSKFFDTKLWTVKFSSAGLVYATFGKDVLSMLTGWDVGSDKLQRLFTKVYESFIMEIDGTDNGVPQSTHKLKYNIRTGICLRVSRLNPWWNEDCKDTTPAFLEAVDFVGREFVETVKYLANCWWPAREFVARAMAKRELIDDSMAIIVLEQSCPWKCHLFDLEREERAESVLYPQPLRLLTERPEPKFPPKVLFVVHPCDDGTWIVQAVPGDNFENRLPLPDSWRALQDSELSRVAGIPGCIFVHGTGHLGMNKTREGAIEMARSVVREFKAKELALSNTPLPPPTFKRGRGAKTAVRGSRFR